MNYNSFDTQSDSQPDFEYMDLDSPTERSERARAEFAESSMLIAKDCCYSLDDMAANLNNNVIAVGGSGTGKTRTIVTPNLCSAVGSYIVCDPKGSLYRKYGGYLRKKGYRILNIDLTHPEKGCCYNPLYNIRTTQDILRIASVIVNEKASEGTRADPFWDLMTTMLLSALISYMVETNYTPLNFSSILKLMREGEREDEDSKVSKLSKRFRRLKEHDPDSWACAQFENVDQAPDKTYDSIRATLSAKFAKFDTEELQKMMSGNDFDFAMLGREKTALFVTVSDTDRSMDSLANIFFTQALQTLCDFADNECADNRLPVPVRLILDDFATNCRIEEFPRMISSMRSRGISVMLLIQSESQLTRSYGEDSSTIISNCDTYVYLGGNDPKTAEAISTRCDKPLGQILYMPVGSCWVFRRGSQPVFTALLDPKPYIREMEL